MDTSKEYIKMCEKAIGIQKLWKVKEGDYACIIEREHNNDLNESVIITEVSRVSEITHFSTLGLKNDYSASWFYPERNIWLPKQDQLQGMLNRTTWHLEQSFHYWFLERSKIKGNSDKRTMEQLWLAFVMKENFNKTWNGKKWIN